MCCHARTGGASMVAVAAGSLWLYATHRVAVETALGITLGAEALLAVALAVYTVRFVLREHAPERQVEHVQTHPAHERERVPHWPDEPLRSPSRQRSAAL